MFLLAVPAIPEGPEWICELKLDGYRAIAFKTGGRVSLRSRNDKDFALRYPSIVEALKKLPEDTIIDGEMVAFDDGGKPSFSALQNYGSSKTPLYFYVFDLMMLRGRNIRNEPLSARRELLLSKVLPKLAEPIRFSPQLEAPVVDLMKAVRDQGFEGLVAKRLDSRYESGLRSGAWVKMRINRGQEFVIGGYTVGGRSFDAIIFGYYEGPDLIYVARTRNGFTPKTREELAKHFPALETAECPFANLPEPRGGRWGQGLTAAKMKECRWLKPALVGQFEFLEWTPDNHLRHSKFVGMRVDKETDDVMRDNELG